jgi:hypothetical protein
MGACFNTRSFSAERTKQEVATLWREAVEDSQYESGHSYSGCIGMLGCDIDWRGNLPIFKSVDDAAEYIEDNHEKWDGPMAVKFMSEGKEYWMIGGWCSS